MTAKRVRLLPDDTSYIQDMIKYGTNEDEAALEIETSKEIDEDIEELLWED